MTRRLFAATLSLGLLAACQVAPAAPPPTTASVAPSAAPTIEPPASPSPLPTATPTPAPSPSPSPSPSGSPQPLGEANHGDAPFPAAPTGGDTLSLTSAKASAGNGDASAIGAIDGKPYTEWAARSGVGERTWLAVDLGTARRFTRVDVLPDASDKVACFFNVEVSDDGKAWRTVAAGKGMGSNESPEWGTAVLDDPTTARYVRVVPTSWGSSWVAVWELRLRN